MHDALHTAAAAVHLYMLLWLAASLVLKRNDVADIAWGAGSSWRPWPRSPHGAQRRTARSSLSCSLSSGAATGAPHRDAEPRQGRGRALPEVVRGGGKHAVLRSRQSYNSNKNRLISQVPKMGTLPLDCISNETIMLKMGCTFGSTLADAWFAEGQWAPTSYQHATFSCRYVTARVVLNKS
jgi:hypothetical protein